jgi:hypothetical protein
MPIFSVLICVVRLALQLPTLNIHNLCQGINLTSPVYFTHGGRWNVVLDQEIGVDTVMRNRLEFNSKHDILEGALVYKVQRKQHIESDEFIQDGLKDIELLVT